MKGRCCHHCEERRPLCHSTCDRYKEWKAKHDEVRDAVRTEKEEQRKLDHEAFIARAKIRKEKPPR